MPTKLVITLVVKDGTIAADVITAVQRGRTTAETEAALTELLREDYTESGITGIVVEQVRVITPAN